MLHRRQIILGLAAAGLVPGLVPAAARAHHGWAWAEDEEFTLAGVIRAVRLGNPHGELDVEAADGLWTAEIGQPYRNERAGLTDALLAPGTQVTSRATARATPKSG